MIRLLLSPAIPITFLFLKYKVIFILYVCIFVNCVNMHHVHLILRETKGERTAVTDGDEPPSSADIKASLKT